MWHQNHTKEESYFLKPRTVSAAPNSHKREVLPFIDQDHERRVALKPHKREVLPSSEMVVVHFSTMMMHTAWLRLDISFSLVAPVARCTMHECEWQRG